MEQTKIPVIKVSVLNKADYIFSLDFWLKMGKMRGFADAFKVKLIDIEGLEQTFMTDQEFEQATKH